MGLLDSFNQSYGNLSDQAKMGLLTAGLGMLANASGPNSHNAFGVGAQQGLQTYNMLNQQNKQEEEKRKAREMQEQLQQQNMQHKQMQMDQLQQETQRQNSMRDALQGALSPLPGLPGKGGQVERPEQAAPSTLDDAYARMIQSGSPDLMLMGLQGQQKLASRANRGNIVGSPIKLGNGNYGYLGADGQIVDTGQQVFNPLKDIDLGGGVKGAFNRADGSIIPVNTADEVAQNEAIVTTATEDAKNQSKAQSEKAAKASEAQEAVYRIGNIRKLVDEMSDSQLGPIAGRLPTMTGSSKLLEMELKNLIGNVRDKLGSGVLTDEDFRNLEKMLPHPTMDKGAFLQALDSFEREMQRRIEAGSSSSGQTMQGGGTWRIVED